MKLHPKVTAGVLCFNESKYIRKCIKSLLNQTYKNLEIIISDNNSIDGSKNILLDEKSKHPEIKINLFNRNHGVIKNLLKTIELSAGEYFFLLSPGDEINKDFVKECMAVHIKKKVSGVMCSTKLRYGQRKIRLINFADSKEFNNLTAYKQSKFMRTYDTKKIEMKFNFFMLGIFDKSILKNITDSFKKSGLSPDNERIVLYCACMSKKFYHIDKLLYTKFSQRKTPRDKTFLVKVEDIDSVLYNLKSIFSIEKVPFFIKVKFSIIILNIINFKIKNFLVQLIVNIKNKIVKPILLKL